MDSIHEECEARGFGHLRGEAYQVKYREVSADFRKRGCVAIGGGECAPVKPQGDELTAAEKAAIVYDLLGDDMDGAASMLDDLG